MRIDDILQDFLSEAEERFSLLESQLIVLEKHPDDTDALAAVFRGAHSLKGTCGFLGFTRLGNLAHAAEDLLSQLRTGTQGLQRLHIDILLHALDVMRRVTAQIAHTGGESAAMLADEEKIISTLAQAAAGNMPDLSMRLEEDTAAPSSLPTVRVGADVLDNLLALGGELALAQARMGQISPLPDAGAMRHMAQLLADLQDEILRARMQPVMEAWRNLPRLVRDMATSAGIRARLETYGGDAQLDRHVLDMVRDPIAHLVRNCLSHGIEPADVRRAAGKSEEGVIQLTARTAEGRMMLSVRDDGRGLDFAAIRRRAVDSGMMRAHEMTSVDDADLAALIFRPGFSTARQVNDLAGRGVGLDAVSAQMALIGGTVDVQAAPGGGTVFTLSIPLTLAMIPAVVIRAGGQTFVLPRAAVAGFARAPRVLQKLGDQLLFCWRGRHIPLMPVADETGDEKLAVIVFANGRYAALHVQSVDTSAQVLVKPLPPLSPHVGRYLGVTILPDGAPALILDARKWAARYGAEISEDDNVAPPPMHQAYLVFHRGGQRAALPVMSVRQIVRVDAAALHRDAQGNMFWPQQGVLRPLQNAPALAADKLHACIILTQNGDAFVCDTVEGILNGDPAVGGQSLLLGGVAAEVVPDAAAPSPAPSGRILLVDDSDFFCGLLTPFLEDAGYTVTSVPDAAHALALRDAGQDFALIISDIEMPGLSGLDFAQQVKQGGSRWRSVPLMALSAHATRHDEKRGRAAGFDDFITKFDRGGLLQKIAGLCGRS